MSQHSAVSSTSGDTETMFTDPKLFVLTATLGCRRLNTYLSNLIPFIVLQSHFPRHKCKAQRQRFAAGHEPEEQPSKVEGCQNKKRGERKKIAKAAAEIVVFKKVKNKKKEGN